MSLLKGDIQIGKSRKRTPPLGELMFAAILRGLRASRAAALHTVLMSEGRQGSEVVMVLGYVAGDVCLCTATFVQSLRH